MSFVSRPRTEDRTLRRSSWRSKTRVRTIWVIHDSLALAVSPSSTTRLSISIVKGL